MSGVYYVTPHGLTLAEAFEDMGKSERYYSAGKAIAVADERHAATGEHFHVVNVTTTWTTTRLTDFTKRNVT